MGKTKESIISKLLQTFSIEVVADLLNKDSNTKPTKPLIKSVHDSLEKEKNRMAEEKSSKEPKKPIIKKEMPIKKIEKKEIVHGNYCSLNCRYCYEEYFDSGGGITGDFDDEGYTEYYCHLRHPISLGSFCKDYE